MVGAVEEGGLEAHHRVPGDDAVANGLLQPLFHGGEVVSGHRAAKDVLLKDQFFAVAGSNSIQTWPYWPWPPVCFLYFPSTLTFLLIRSR